jgi:hypothetical protein
MTTKQKMPYIIKNIDDRVEKIKNITNTAMVKINENVVSPVLKYSNNKKKPMPLINSIEPKYKEKLEKKPMPLISNDENMKCSPLVNFRFGSCFPLNILLIMVKAHNKLNVDDEIPICDEISHSHESHFKVYLIQELEQRYGKIHKKWSEAPFMDLIDNDTQQIITKEIFRPLGPTNTEWLNSLQINDVMHQYETLYKKFIYLDTVPRDFYIINSKYSIDFDLYKKYGNKTTFGLVINSDKHNQSGSHWKMLYFNTEYGKIYYIDSGGGDPEDEIVDFINYVKDYLHKKNIPIEYVVNDKKYQFDGYSCGPYSMFFMNALLEMSVEDPKYTKNPIEELKNKNITDEVVHEWRKVFFSKY